MISICCCGYSQDVLHIDRNHRLNMEFRSPKFIWAPPCHVMCTQLYSLAETPATPPSPRIWTRIMRALLVSKDRRHLFVTPWQELMTVMRTHQKAHLNLVRAYQCAYSLILVRKGCNTYVRPWLYTLMTACNHGRIHLWLHDCLHLWLHTLIL